MRLRAARGQWAHLFGRGRQRTQQASARDATQVLPETTWGDDALPSGIPPEGSIVVTLARQFGTGGSEIGKLAASESGLQYLDSEIINEVARRLGINEEHAQRQDEQTSGMANRILDAIRASHLFPVNYSTLLGSTPASAQSREFMYLRLTQRVILEVASRGNALMVGRGSQFLLHNSPRTLHIYLFAPLPYRIDAVMKQYQLDRDRAQRLIEQRDYEQDMYMRRYYGSDGHQSGLYHLLINTGLFSYELAAHLIHQALPVVKDIR